jgi:hypothetical protein
MDYSTFEEVETLVKREIESIIEQDSKSSEPISNTLITHFKLCCDDSQEEDITKDMIFYKTLPEFSVLTERDIYLVLIYLFYLKHNKELIVYTERRNRIKILDLSFLEKNLFNKKLGMKLYTRLDFQIANNILKDFIETQLSIRQPIPPPNITFCCNEIEDRVITENMTHYKTITRFSELRETDIYLVLLYFYYLDNNDILWKSNILNEGFLDTNLWNKELGMEFYRSHLDNIRIFTEVEGIFTTIITNKIDRLSERELQKELHRQREIERQRELELQSVLLGPMGLYRTRKSDYQIKFDNKKTPNEIFKERIKRAENPLQIAKMRICCNLVERRDIMLITDYIKLIPTYNILSTRDIYLVLVYIYYSLRYGEQTDDYLGLNTLLRNIPQANRNLAEDLYIKLTAGDIMLDHPNIIDGNLSKMVRRNVLFDTTESVSQEELGPTRFINLNINVDQQPKINKPMETEEDELDSPVTQPTKEIPRRSEIPVANSHKKFVFGLGSPWFGPSKRGGKSKRKRKSKSKRKNKRNLTKKRKVKR